MSNSLIDSLLFFFLVCFNLSNGYNLHVFSPNNEEFQERISQINEFHGSTQRTLRLADGRSVSCTIPTYSSMHKGNFLDVGEEFHLFQTPKKEIMDYTYLKNEQADFVLRALENQCTEYRTTTFLWQFCYKKYLRQFDDWATLINAQKQNYEDIYAGYFESYNKTSNLTNDESSINYYQVQNLLESSSIIYATKIFKINPHILDPNVTISLPYIFVEDKLIQLVGFKNVTLSPSNQLVIKLKLAQSGKGNMVSIKINRMISKNIGLISRNFPPPNQVLSYSLKVKTNVDISRNPNIISIFDGTYVYGTNMNAFKQFSIGDTVFIYAFQGLFIKQVKRVLNSELLELEMEGGSQNFEELKQKELFVDTIQILSRENTMSFSKFTVFQKKEKYLSGSTLLGVDYTHSKKNDILLFISRNQIITARVINVMPCCVQIDQNLTNFIGYIVKPDQINEQKKINSTHSLSKGQFYFQQKATIHQATQPSTFYPLVISLRQNENAAPHIDYIDLEVFQFSEDKVAMDQRYFMFIPSFEILSKLQQVKVVLSNSLEDNANEAIQIDFKVNQIVAFDVNNKTNINQKNKRYENSTLSDRINIWILIENHKSIRIGFSSVISPQTQVLQLRTNYSNLRYLRILAKQTQGVDIITPFQGVIENKLDFSILDPNPSLPINSKVLQSIYTEGEFCDPIKANRSFTVDFRCGASFFSLISVTEPSVCVYHVSAETYLLCQNEQTSYNFPPPPKNLICAISDQKQN